jgi:hypothetical protein
MRAGLEHLFGPSPGRLRARAADGLLYFEQVIAPQIRAAVTAGQRCAIVFDIDNTLVDTRYRTLAAAREFGRRFGIRQLASARIEDIGIDGRSTCLNLGVKGRWIMAFQAFWLRFFWDPKNFHYDRTIKVTAKLAKRASDLGAEVFYLTGRTELLRDGSRTELQDKKFPNADDAHLIMKPRLGIDTTMYKIGRLLGGLGVKPLVRVLAFVSDGGLDLLKIADASAVPTIQLAFPLQRSRFGGLGDVPTIVMA